MESLGQSVGHGIDVLQPVVELHGHRLPTDRQNLQGVFVHAQLSVGHLHAPHKFLDVIRKAIEVVALALKGENGRLLVGGLHGQSGNDAASIGKAGIVNPASHFL